MEYFGRRGKVTVDSTTEPRIAKKETLSLTHTSTLHKEADIIQKLNQAHISFVPQLIERGEGRFSYHWIVGDAFDKVFPQLSLKQQQIILNELIEKAHQLDLLGVVHGELDKPMSNILINTSFLEECKESLFFIDFERGQRQDFSGKNMRHVMQALHYLGYVNIEQLKTRGKESPKNISSKLKDVIMQPLFSQKSLSPKNWLLFGSMIGLLLGLDMFTKRLFYNLQRGSHLTLLTPVFNTGVGWSIPIPVWVSACLAGILIVILLKHIYKTNSIEYRMIFFIAGAAGNAIDRLLLGGVRDFIDLQQRPVFNGADIFLSIAGVLLIREIRTETTTKTKTSFV